MTSLAFLIPGRLETRTGGYEYDRQVVAALRAAAWTVSVGRLDDSFPLPTAGALAQAARLLAEQRDGAIVLIDGLALGAMPDEVAGAGRRLRLIGLVHHPLADETGLDPKTASRLHESERRALASVRRVIVTSARTGERLESAYDVPRDRIVVVEPGTARAPLARGSGGSSLQLLCVASCSPRKGQEVLVRALAALVDRPWALTCVGGLDHYPETVARLRELIAQYALTDRVRLCGEAEADRVAEYFDQADVFVLPTWYEGYGMVVAEALARGLPVISTPTGAIPALVGRGAGILVQAGDVAGWTSALSRMFDQDLRRHLAEGARARRESLPTWADAAARLAAALEAPEVSTHRG